MKLDDFFLNKKFSKSLGNLKISWILGARRRGGPGINWGQYWIDQGIFDLLWTGDISGNELIDISGNNNNIIISDKDFDADYIPSDSLATFSIPNVEAIKTDDSDLFWTSSEGIILNKVVTELSGVDLSRTIIKYDNVEPYHVRWIGILKSSIVLTQDQIDKLHTSFNLWIWWSGVLNDNGYFKDNRSIDPIDTTLNLSYTLPSPFARQLILVGKNGEDSCIVDWGDGASTALIMDGTEKTLNHTYLTSGVKDITISNCHNLIEFITNSTAATHALTGNIEEFAKCINLEKLYLYGNNVNGGFSGNIEKLPLKLKELTFYSLPSTMSGDLGYLSTTLIKLNISNTNGVSCSLNNIAARYAALDTLNLTSLAAGKLVGSIDYMPESLDSLTIIYNSGGITGSSSSLPSNLSYLYLSLLNSSTSITALGLPRNLLYLRLINLRGQSSGTFLQLPQNLTSLYLNIARITGVIEELPSSLTYLEITGNDVINPYGAGIIPIWANLQAKIQNSWTTAILDAFLNSWATTAGAGTKTWDLAGTNQPRSSASDSAVATLESLGKIFTFNT
jgi:hypothetical protein